MNAATGDLPAADTSAAWRPALAGALTWIVLAVGGAPSTALAQIDDDFENALAELCIFDLPPDASDELLALCDEIIPGFGAPFDSGSFRSSSNLGVVGAQNRTSSSSLSQQQQAIDEQMNKDDEDTGIRGKASSGDFKLGNLGVFFAYSLGEDDRAATTLESGFEADLRGVTGGFNYLFGDELIGGVLLGYNKQEAVFDGGAGTLDARTRTISAYLTWTPLSNAYVGAYAGYGSLDHDSVRVIRFGSLSSTAVADPEGEQRIAGISTGYDHFIGAGSIGAFAGLDYAASDIDAYRETDSVGLAFAFAEQKIRSLKSTLGVRADYTASFGWGLLVPSARVSWVHEYRDDARTISAALNAAPTTTVALRTDSPDRDFLLFGAGVTASPAENVQMFLDYERMEGHRYLDSWSLSAGIVANF